MKGNVMNNKWLIATIFSVALNACSDSENPNSADQPLANENLPAVNTLTNNNPASQPEPRPEPSPRPEPNSNPKPDQNTETRGENKTDSDTITTYDPADPDSPITVKGGTISWLEKGWYEVQRSTNSKSLCEGTRFCSVRPGSYIVINHSTGERIVEVVVPDITDTVDKDKEANREDIDVYLLSGQSNANVEMHKQLEVLLKTRYANSPVGYSTAHWYRGGAAIRLWVDLESNTLEYWNLMMKQLQSEVNEQHRAGKQVRSVSMIWIQGEDDAFEGATNYNKYFTALVNNWNEEISASFGVPAYVSSGLPWAEECHIAWDNAFKTGLPRIRNAQKKVARKFASVDVWETSDIRRSDCLHIADHRLAMTRALNTLEKIQKE